MTAPDGKTAHIFEMRTYMASAGNLPNLLERFRKHTVGLFSKHGMKHFGYFVPLKDQLGHEDTLIYFLIHSSQEAHAASFAAFGADSNWQTAKAASEKAASGSLTTADGVKSQLLLATDYSPAK